MFTVSVETRFRAPHRLPLPASKGSPAAEAEPLHYHDWLVTADVGSDKLNSMGFVMDFHRLKAALDNIVADAAPKMTDKKSFGAAPSAENVARYIYEKLEPKLPKGVKLQNIRVVEEPGCSAKFDPHHRRANRRQKTKDRKQKKENR